MQELQQIGHHATSVGAPLETLVQRKLLTFGVGGELFGLGIAGVKEILEYGSITHIPMMPEHIAGVINLRGAVMPVVDLAARLERPRSKPGRRTCIVIVEVAEAEERYDVGVVVDAVNEVLDIADDSIEPAPSFGTTIRADFIAGMARDKERFIVVLRENSVLSVDDLARVS